MHGGAATIPGRVTAYILPAWLVYLLWDNEFYYVRDLAEDPLP